MAWSKNHGKSAKDNANYAKEQANIAKQEVSNLAELKTEVEIVTENASKATQNANTAKTNADNAASNASTQAEHAKTQADRAKTEADRLAGTDVSVLDNKVTNISQKVDTEIGKVAQQLAETVSEIEAVTELKADRAEVSDLKNQKADISYVNQQVQVSNLSWKESHSTLTALQTAFPNGDIFNHVILADGFIYTWKNNAWVNTQITAAGINVPKNSVTPVKTVMFLPTQNLLDPYQLENGYTDFSNGKFLTHATYKVTPFIKVNGGLNYVANKASRGYAFYDASYVFISAVENTNWHQVVRAPTNAVYMRVTFSGSTNFGDAQLEQGDKVTTYTKPHILDPLLVKNINAKNSIVDKSVSMDKLEFSIKSTKNFFNYLTDIDSATTYALPTNGTLSTSTSYAFKVTKPIEVQPGQSYISNGRIRSVAFYDGTYAFVSGIGTILEPGSPFIAPTNSAFMRINFYSSNDLKTVQLEKGTVATSFEPYQYIESFIRPKSITAEKISDDVLALLNNEGNKWEGKAFVSLGTSIVWYDGKTYPDGTVSRGYQTHLKNQLGFASYLNKGVSGSSMANGTRNGDGTNTHGKTVDYSQFDLVTIEAGSNDYKLEVPLGSRGLMSDTTFDTSTFYGAYRDLLQYILTQKPTIRIVLFTPPRRKQSGYTDEGLNTQNLKMYDYVLAVKDIAEMYGLPIVDQWHESGINYYNASVYTIDGVHPNNLGYERLGELAVGRIKDL